MDCVEWEYKHLRSSSFTTVEDLIRQLNKEGQKGWEMCGMVGKCPVLKRPTYYVEE